MHPFKQTVFTILMSVLLFGAAPVHAAESTREMVITNDGDYFGFDLRVEKDVDIGLCETICLSDKQCNAFTYNPKVQWCFLKTDFGQLKSAPGSIAGKVIEVATGEDLGAPEPLSFTANYVDAAAQYRAPRWGRLCAVAARLGHDAARLAGS